MLNISAFFIKRELERRGYEVSTFADRDLLLIRAGEKQLYTHASKVLLDSSGYLICKDKALARKVLTHFGFPLAKGTVVSEGTIELVSSLTAPYALKPIKESGGTNVQLNVQNKEDIRAYFADHPQYREILVEEMLEGEDIRILVVGGRFFAACQRQPAFVVGDGAHTIVELVDRENRRREHLHQLQRDQQTYLTNLERIRFDSESIALLRSQSRSPNDIPKALEVVRVRTNANVSTGGIAIDVTARVSIAIRQMSEAIAAKLSLPLVGIDIMTKDLTKPLQPLEKSGIIEINGSPAIGLHALVDEGEPRDPTPLLVDRIEAFFSE